MEQINALSTTKNNSLGLSAESRVSSVIKIWPTIEHFFNDYPKNFLILSGRMAADCITNDMHPSLNILTKAFSYNKAKGWVMAQLTVFNEQYTTDRKMSPFQLESCADLLIQNFPALKCSELALCLNRILSGAYGEVMYGTVEYTKITAVLNNQFKEEKDRIWDEYRKEEIHRSLTSPYGGMSYEEYCRRVGKDPKDNPLSKLQEDTNKTPQRSMKTNSLTSIMEGKDDEADFAEKKRKFLAPLLNAQNNLKI